MEETGQNPRGERTKKMKLKGGKKEEQKCKRRAQELQKRKKVKTYSMGKKKYFGENNTEMVKVTAR